MSATPHDVRQVVVAPRPVAGVRAEVRRGQVGQECMRYLDQVYAAARSGAISLDGQNIFIYRAATADHLTVEFCVGITAPFEPVGDVVPLSTPGGRALVATHWGDYAGLSAANDAIRAWARAHGHALAGPSWEVYGHWDADPAKRRTDIYWTLT